MENHLPIHRRDFLIASSTLAASAAVTDTALHASATTTGSELAIHGGPKALKSPVPKFARWGDPERRRLESMIGQDTLFYWRGPQTTALIERFQKICPTKYVMTCSSGTAALHIAVASSGLKPGDEVITSPITDIGTVIGAVYQQAVPVFADLIPNTYNLDPADVERKITPKTKAIIAVHLGGNPCDMERLRAIADKHQLVLIEDCAQAWGTLYRGKPIGTLGHIACFSLQQSKQVTCGDGGVVASNDDRFGPLLQRFGDKGFDRLGTSGLFESFAPNYRMSEPQAAVAAAQLDRVEEIASKRSSAGNLLNEKLRGIHGIEPHHVDADDRCTYWLSMFRIQPSRFRCNRAEFVKALVAEGVAASAGYIPVPLYGNPVFQQHGFFGGHWPVKEFGLTSMDYSKVKCAEAESILNSGIRLVVNEAMMEDYILGAAEAVKKVATHFAI
ncbi:MAG: DegT/DnrJ/EryC1/StrS family aminotransferase [Pirellula sp.]